DNARSFSDVAAVGANMVTLSDSGPPEMVIGHKATPSLFPLLGVQPILGRALAEGDDAPGREPVVALSHALWPRRFGADPSLIGRKIGMNGEPVTIVGVMPKHFYFAPFWVQAEYWMPLPLAGDATNRRAMFIRTIARLREGVSVEAAQAEIAVL